jgi:hypothetical protein
MSRPEERDHLNSGGVPGAPDETSAADSGAAARTGHSDVEESDLSDTGVGLSVGDSNTFEPEEAGPAAETPAERPE